jgi:orotate phosphoribosyltransferase
MVERKILGRELINTAFLFGDKNFFTLSSGEKSSIYIDKYAFESTPEILRGIAHALNEILPEETELLAGTELGGIPLSTSLSLISDIPQVFVRKDVKGYGTKNIIEGRIPIVGRNVCVIEDIVTTGEQTMATIEKLRKEQAVVKNALCVVLRESEAAIRLSEQGIKLLPLFTFEQLEEI